MTSPPKPIPLTDIESLMAMMQKFQIDSLSIPGLRLTKRTHVLDKKKDEQLSSERDQFLRADPDTQDEFLFNSLRSSQQ